MRLIIIFAIISISFCILKSANADTVVANNKNRADRESEVLAEILLKLNTLIEENEKLSKKIENLSERFENKLQLIKPDIEDLKNVVNIQKNTNEYLQIEKETVNVEPPAENLVSNSNLPEETVNIEQSSENLIPKSNTLEETASIEPPTEILESDNNTLKGKQKSYSWTIIQRRQDGSVEFNRNWDDYKTGFGNPNGEVFIGLDKIHELTSESQNELLIILKDFYGNTKYAHYDNFLIGSEEEKYQLKSIGNYRGTAGDNLRNHLSMYFSTKDRDNDVGPEGSCAEWFEGAWWYYHCMTSNLNGPYRTSPYLFGSMRGQGITWGNFEQIQYAYKFAQMMIRPKKVKVFNAVDAYN